MCVCVYKLRLTFSSNSTLMMHGAILRLINGRLRILNGYTLCNKIQNGNFIIAFAKNIGYLKL